MVSLFAAVATIQKGSLWMYLMTNIQTCCFGMQVLFFTIKSGGYVFVFFLKIPGGLSWESRDSFSLVFFFVIQHYNCDPPTRFHHSTYLFFHQQFLQVRHWNMKSTYLNNVFKTLSLCKAKEGNSMSAL